MVRPAAIRPLSSRRCRSNHIPGAVPWALCSTVQHSGTKACARLSSLNSMPRLSRSVRMCSASAGAKTRCEPNSSQSVCFVISSLVGPRPPVMITMSLMSSPRPTAEHISAALSPTDDFSMTVMPAELRWRAIDTVLVSTICPIRISSPMVMTVAFIDCRVVHRAAPFAASQRRRADAGICASIFPSLRI